MIEIVKLYQDEEFKNSDELLEDIVKKLRHKDCDLFELYNYIMPWLWGNDSIFSVKNKYASLRNAIEHSTIGKARKDKFLEVFKIHPNTYKYLLKVQNENMKNRINDSLEFSKDSYLENMQKVKNIIVNKDFDTIRVNRQKNDYLLANLSALYFAMATGRRPWEIFQTVEISKVGKTVYYKGLAKKRDNEEVEFIAFPLDEDYHFLKKCLENVRKYYSDKDMDNKKFNQGVQQTWNKFAKYILDDKKVSYSVIRSMYSEIAVETQNKDNLDKEIFRRLVLSHAETVMSATDYYRKTKAV